MNNLLKVIKRNNKKRGINVTIATMVMFLLCCTGIYAATTIDTNEKEYILHVGADGKPSYQWGSNGKLNTIDQDKKLIINGKLEVANKSQSLEISSNAKDVTVENNGMIDGVTIGRDLGKLDGTNAIFTNNGVVSNEGNAVVVYSKNATVNNYGIIKGGEKGIELANGIDQSKINNKGIIINKDGKIIKASTTDELVTLEGKEYTVKNAVNSDGTTAQAIVMNGSANKSFENYLINGLATTISVTSTGNTISNSIINSTGNALEISKDGEVGLTSTTVNGNVTINGGTLTLTDDKNKFNGKISGTTGNDSVKLGYQVTKDTNYTNLNTILKDSGVDILKFSDAGNTIDTSKISFSGKLQGGAGADTFKVASGKVMGINIDGGEGENDTLELTGQYLGSVADFSGVTGVETLQLGNGNNELNISEVNGKFTTIKGGEYGSSGSGSNVFITTGDIGETLTLVGGTGGSVKNILKLNNRDNTIDFKGKLNSNGGNWSVLVDNLKDGKEVTLGKENLNGKVTSLGVVTGVKGEDETTNLVKLLEDSGINYTTLSTERTITDKLMFKDTTLTKKTTFGVDYNDSITMKNTITGDYEFRALGSSFTPTVNVDSSTEFKEGTKVTSINSQGQVSGVNFKVTEGALKLGTLNYSNNSFTYSGANPFVDNVKYTINGDIKLEIAGLTGAELSAGKTLGSITKNENITLNGKLILPSFLKYNNGNFVVKSWAEMNPYGDKNSFLEKTYNDMLSKYGQAQNDAITSALNNWSKEALVSYINGNTITQYDFTLDGKTYENILLTGENAGISKEFKVTGDNGGNITFRNIATSNGLTLDLTGEKQSNILLDENVNIGGDITFGENANVNLTINARSVASTVKNIIGNAKDSVIKLTHVKITGDNKNGKIDLGAGTDTLTLNNVEVNTITGSGKNTIELNQGSKVNNITLDKESSVVEGTFASLEVQENSFENSIVVNDGAEVEKIDLSKVGSSSITLNSGKIQDITFGSGNDILTYNGGTIKSVDFGAGENVLNVRADLDLSNTKITVSEDGSIKNILNVGKQSSRSTDEGYLTLSGDFSAFKDINIQGTTKLSSNIILSNDTSVNFAGNKVIVGLKTSENGGVTTVLDGTNVTGSNGTLVLDTASVGIDTDISLENINGLGNEIKVESNYIGHNLVKDEDGNYVVEINQNIIEGEGNNLAQGILSTTYGARLLEGLDREQQIAFLSGLTHDITYSAPYSYSNVVSRKTTEMVSNAVMSFDAKASKNQWLAYGSILGSGKELKDYYSGVQNSSTSIDTDIYGAYVQAEYGYADDTAVGFVVGANKSSSDIGKSSLDGRGTYLGGYVKHNSSENLQIIGGLAYQYSSYESERVAGITEKMITASEKYNDSTISAFVGGKYEHKLSETLVVEPNAKLNITYIQQDGIEEKTEDLALKTNSKNFTNINTEIGVDLVKTVKLQNGNVKLKAGTSLTYLIDGAEKESLKTTIIDAGTTYNMLTPEQDKTNVKFKVGAQYEKSNGVLYNVEGSYTTSSNEKEWVVGAGIGYRF